MDTDLLDKLTALLTESTCAVRRLNKALDTDRNRRLTPEEGKWFDKRTLIHEAVRAWLVERGVPALTADRFLVDLGLHGMTVSWREYAALAAAFAKYLVRS